MKYAFPCQAGETVEDSQGMSLRDYFAAKAMAEVNWLRPSPGQDMRDFNLEAAIACYEIADAMLEARDK